MTAEHGEQKPGCRFYLSHPFDTLKSIKESYDASAETGGAGTIVSPQIKEPSQEALEIGNLSIPQLVKKRINRRARPNGPIADAASMEDSTL